MKGRSQPLAGPGRAARAKRWRGGIGLRLAIGPAIAAMLIWSNVHARPAQPMPLPPPPPIPSPRDVAFPGTLTVAVDATDLAHGIFSVKETIPVVGRGSMVLAYPQWLPGEHAPKGDVDELAGLEVRADGHRIEWRRDTLDAFAFHVDPPRGTKALDIEFRFLSPLSSREGRVQMTPEMLNAQWISLALYPAGYFTRDIPVAASVRLPAGWRYATALETERVEGDWVRFKTTSFNTFADSPLIAGRYTERVDLAPGGPAPVRLFVAADAPEDLQINAEHLQEYKRLVQEAHRLFGSHHFDHYDFLLTLSDTLGGIGLEHHQSSEDGDKPGYFTDWNSGAAGRDLLPHEFVHSWNGKFRRPADLWTPTFNTPMRDSLLWVYEGLTQYWGYVLTARSGLLSKQDSLDRLAIVAAEYDHRIGRTWRTLEDTTNDPIIAPTDGALAWPSWQRIADYYAEGQLIWLDVDTLIRQRSGGKRSLDDFARAFFGIDDGSYVTQTYTFDDVVTALNSVEPYDWASFLKARLESHGPGAPLNGLTRGGYQLIYTERPTALTKGLDARWHIAGFDYSLGFTVGANGQIRELLWNSPAFAAGMSTDSQLIAVNGVAYTADTLRRAVTAAKTDKKPIELLVEAHDHFQTIDLDYHDGLKYPHLDKLGSGDTSLDTILSPGTGT